MDKVTAVPNWVTYIVAAVVGRAVNGTGQRKRLVDLQINRVRISCEIRVLIHIQGNARTLINTGSAKVIRPRRSRCLTHHRDRIQPRHEGILRTRESALNRIGCREYRKV